MTNRMQIGNIQYAPTARERFLYSVDEYSNEVSNNRREMTNDELKKKNSNGEIVSKEKQKEVSSNNRREMSDELKKKNSNGKIVSKEKQKEIFHEPYKYLVGLPAGYFRWKLAEAINIWLQIPQDKVQIIEEFSDICHNSSLLIDDIQDGSAVRRGETAAHLIYGNEITLIAASSMYCDGIMKIMEFNDFRAVKIGVRALKDLLLGQEMELEWIYNGECPTEEDYCKMCYLKTGTAFSLSVEMMQLFSNCKYDFRKLVVNLGLLFQISNDYKYLSECPPTDKSFCEDFTEGKFTFPIIHAIRTHPEDKRIAAIVRQKTENIHLKKHLLSLLEKYGSLNYTKMTIVQLKKTIAEEVDKLGGNTQLLELVDSLILSTS